MDIRYYPEPDAGEPHIYAHDVTEQEVEDVLRRPGEDRPGREGSRSAIGQTRDGRYLRVIYALDDDGQGLCVITAYDLVGKPLKAYRRRMRHRGER